jgi:hypothetical protein
VDFGETTGELIAGLIYLIAGARLVALGLRTGEAPERLLGTSFLLMGAGSLVYSASMIFPIEALWTPLNFTGRLLYVFAFVLVAQFTRRVFRSSEHWGGWLVAGTAVAFALGVGGSAVSGDFEGFNIRSAWYWMEWIAYAIPVTWACAEATAQHLQARRRVRVGLCEPLVCNRLLLWALFAGLQVAANFITVGQYAAFERSQVFSAEWDYIYSAVSVASLAMMWIAFFPPGIYKRWINGANHIQTVEQG